MTPPGDDLLESRRGAAAVVGTISLLFLALRAAMLFAREPFFDELFTLWIARKPFPAIVEALRQDSGPPLYYFLVHLVGIRTVLGARLLSLLCAAVSYALIVRSPSLGRGRFTAAALLALFPPAVLFAVDARAYALCAMFVTIAIVLLASRRAVGAQYGAAVALALAAWSHYYGALFFPILLIPLSVPPGGEGDGGRPRPQPAGVSPDGDLSIRRDEASLLHRLASLALALLLFAPGVALALRQPQAAIDWMSSALRWPDALLARPPLVLLGGAIAIALLAAARVNRFTLIAAIPLIAAAALALAGRHVYFPLRFESVLAVPLALAIAVSLQRWRPLMRVGLLAPLLLAGFAVSYAGVIEHLRRPPDEYRIAARWVAQHVPPHMPVVATGYLYLEAVMNGRPDASAFPSEQAEHPGWRAPLTREAPPAGSFVWVGEARAPELALIARSRKVEPLFIEPRAIVVLVR